ncbi:hypothetical protein DL93DRAFT_2174093, partial [Clavulina sp. PMI_390]
MDEGNNDQAPSLSPDEFREWALATFPALASLSLDHLELPPSMGSGSPSLPVRSDLAQQSSDASNSNHSSGRRRQRATSARSTEEAGSSRPRKRAHLDRRYDLADGGQEFIPQNSSFWHGGQVHRAILPGQAQTYLLDPRQQGYTRTTSYPITPAMASSSTYSLPMQRLELSSNLPSALDVSLASSLPVSYKIPSTHAFGNMHNFTHRKAEPNAVHSDRNPSATHPPPHFPANVPLGTSTLVTRFGILDPHDLSQLPHTEAAKILDQIYI